MAIITSIGTKFYVSAAVPATNDAAGFGALTWTQIKNVVGFPTSSPKVGDVTYTTIEDGITQHLHGSIDHGSTSVKLAHDPLDAGLIIVKAGNNNGTNHSFKVVDGAGDIRYQSGLISNGEYPEPTDTAVNGYNFEVFFNTVPVYA